MGSSAASILIGFIRGDGSATLAYYHSGTFSGIATGTAPIGWVAALGSGQAILGISRSAIGVALVAGINGTIEGATLRTVASSTSSTVAIYAAAGDYFQYGIDVDTTPRASGTVVRAVEVKTAVQGGGSL